MCSSWKCLILEPVPGEGSSDGAGFAMGAADSNCTRTWVYLQMIEEPDGGSGRLALVPGGWRDEQQAQCLPGPAQMSRVTSQKSGYPDRHDTLELTGLGYASARQRRWSRRLRGVGARSRRRRDRRLSCGYTCSAVGHQVPTQQQKVKEGRTAPVPEFVHCTFRTANRGCGEGPLQQGVRS